MSSWQLRTRPSGTTMTGHCKACGDPCDSTKKWCSNACRQWAYRQRMSSKKAIELVDRASRLLVGDKYEVARDMAEDLVQEIESA